MSYGSPSKFFCVNQYALDALTEKPLIISAETTGSVGLFDNNIVQEREVMTNSVWQLCLSTKFS